MTRGPALVAHGADQLLILLQVEGSCDTDCGGRRGRIEPGDVAIFDYARPFRSVVTDYENLIVHPCARERARGTAGASSRTALSFRAGAARRV